MEWGTNKLSSAAVSAGATKRVGEIQGRIGEAGRRETEKRPIARQSKAPEMGKPRIPKYPGLHGFGLCLSAFRSEDLDASIRRPHPPDS